MKDMTLKGLMLTTTMSVFAAMACNLIEKKEAPTPDSIGNLIYSNSFDFSRHPYQNNTRLAIHKKSLCFNSKDSTLIVINKKFKFSSDVSLAFWLQPEFYWRNGTIINLSEKEKDFPIKSELSIFMNKNRIGIMQRGKDLRKEDYINQREFTNYFLSRSELKTGNFYFFVYVYSKNKVTLYIDGNEYAKFEKVPNLNQINYITFGASWNDNGTKYHFNGCIDDLYIYDRALNIKEINDLMDYTHVYQFVK